MKPQHANEKEIIRRAQAGDEIAFEELIQVYSPVLYRVVRRMSCDPQETESIVQEAFWRTWRSLGKYNNDAPFFPYLITIALNLQRDLWRKEQGYSEIDVEVEFAQVEDAKPGPEKLSEDREVLEYLEDAVNQLPLVYRTVIALRYQGEMSYDEIAKTLKLPVNTVRTYLFRAKQLLRKHMEVQNGQAGFLPG
jgi:RNA polymerase sigma-70 factor (ECF subfamily)